MRNTSIKLAISCGICVVLIAHLEAYEDPPLAVLPFRASTDAEVHFVGIYQPLRFGVQPDDTDIKDWPQLLASLNGGKPAVTRFCRSFSEQTKKLLVNDAALQAIVENKVNGTTVLLKTGVAHGLSDALIRNDIYDEASFKGIKLSETDRKSAMDLSKATLRETLRVNRGLLSSAFPDSITGPPELYHSVRVTVGSGKPVILVLASYHSTSWEVVVKDGGSVKGIVLCGYDPQEALGVDCPILERTYKARKRERPDREFLYCYEKKGESFEKLAKEVLRITGKDFQSFQGKNTPTKGGFVVTPSSK